MSAVYQALCHRLTNRERSIHTHWTTRRRMPDYQVKAENDQAAQDQRPTSAVFQLYRCVSWTMCPIEAEPPPGTLSPEKLTAIFLSNWALGAMPNQQRKQQQPSGPLMQPLVSTPTTLPLVFSLRIDPIGSRLPLETSSWIQDPKATLVAKPSVEGRSNKWA